MKTVIVTPQLPTAYKNGGIGTFTRNFADIILETGDDLTLIFTHYAQAPEEEWKPYYTERGIEVHSAMTADQPPRIAGEIDFVQTSDCADRLIPPDADIVYFADWQASGLSPIRRKRFDGRGLPLVVTVLHGSTEWHRQGMQYWPSSYDEMILDYGERYCAQYSDYVAAASTYIVDWARRNSWKLPPDENIAILGLPFHPSIPTNLVDETQPPDYYRRLIFFGTQSTRKGFEIFVDAVEALHDDPCMATIDEVVFLGQESVNRRGSVQTVAERLRQICGVETIAHHDFDTFQAQRFLSECAADSLVVIPSRSESFGYAIIEASLIRGLNMIHSNAGGAREVLGENGQHLMFEPRAEALAQKLQECLAMGPRLASELPVYAWRTANQRWKAFHEELRRRAAVIRRQPKSALIKSFAPTKSVDVCIPYHNLGEYLPDLLESLDRQSTDDFNVFVVNDGSTESASLKTFDRLKAAYKREGWYFVSQENQGVCVTRNLAAALGSAPYIIFVDADNIMAANGIDRFLSCARNSGDDALTCYLYVFQGKTPFVKRPQDGIVRPPDYVYIPVGNTVSAGLMENPFGDLGGIIRRSAFEAIGGFTDDMPQYANHEDRELFTRLSFAGYKLDVIPEYLFFYRFREQSRLRTTSAYWNEMRVLRVYEEILSVSGLEDVAPLVLGLKHRVRDLEQWQRVGGHGYRSDDGTVFPTRDEYLVNGVRWMTLVAALGAKAKKRLKRLLP